MENLFQILLNRIYYLHNMTNLEKLKNQIINKYTQELNNLDKITSSLIKSRIYKKCLKSNIDLCEYISTTDYANDYLITYSSLDILSKVNLSVNFDMHLNTRYLYVTHENLLPTSLQPFIRFVNSNVIYLINNLHTKPILDIYFYEIWNNMNHKSKIQLIKLINEIEPQVLKNILHQFPNDLQSLLILT